MLSNQMNNGLLFEIETIDLSKPVSRETAGKCLKTKLNRLRRELAPAEGEFDYILADAVKRIQKFALHKKDSERSSVLFAIEYQCSHTTQEIVEDTELKAGIVKEIIEKLLTENLIEKLPRLTIGGSANQVLIFSKRKPCSCV